MKEVTDETRIVQLAIETAISGTGSPPSISSRSRRGLVICAGGTQYFTNAWVLVKLLRFHGCELPIELWALDKAELDDNMRGLVEPLGVKVCYAGDVFSTVNPESVRGRWQWVLKPYSIVHSAFDEVLYLDADNFPVRNPADLFECEAYLAQGSLFWPDIRMAEEENPIWGVMEVPYRCEPEFETGQMLIHKQRCWEPLQLALWMNLRSDFFYNLIWGDKDTFRFAWHKFGRSFGMVPYAAQLLEMPSNQSNYGAMCQHDFHGNWLFQHRNMAKWHLLEENPRIPGFLFEPQCREFLKELRGQWNGWVSGTPGDYDLSDNLLPVIQKARRDLQEGFWLLEDRRPSLGGCCRPAEEWSEVRIPFPWRNPVDFENLESAERALAFQRMHSKGFRCREITFLSDSIGRGASSEFCWWRIKLDPASKGLVLELQGVDKNILLLEDSKDGSWQGSKVENDGRGFQLRLLRLDMIYPEMSNAKLLTSDCPKHPVHVANHAFGIGDAITGLYAVTGLAEAGIPVVYHTRHPGWLGRARVTGLTITDIAPPEGAVDLNADYSEQIRYTGDKARWYAMLAAAGVPDWKHFGIAAPPYPPARPLIDFALPDPVMDVNDYVLLAPFAASTMRDWPETHWRRLAFLLSESGFEVVAVGAREDEQRMRKTFERSCAYWVLDQSPEWVIAAMLRAQCVIGPDSGMIHLAGLLGVPAVCIHSQLPPSFLFSHAPSVHSVAPKVECVYCRWQIDNGYNDSCSDACSALATISPEQILLAVQSVEVTQARAEVLLKVAEDTNQATYDYGGGGGATSAQVKERRVDVIAYTLRPNCGMGEAAEANIRAMRALGITVEQRLWEGDLTNEPWLRDPNQIYYHHWHPEEHDTSDMWHYFLPRNGAGAHHIAYWAYEIEGGLPKSFLKAAPIITEIWTPSSFCKTLFEQTGLPVHIVPHAVPTIDRLDELPSTGGKAPYTVLTMFDAWSRLGRKNPQAVIRVFQNAFPQRMDVRLILKARYLTQEQRTELESEFGWDSRIRVLNQFLSESDRDRLFASSDVYLGLQRSEGFGLNLARSLGMGLPLITTGWSGLLDFCREDNCHLVPYTLKIAREVDSDFTEIGVWAEPDEHAAADLLTKLSKMTVTNDPALGRIRMNGLATIRNEFGEAALIERMRIRFEDLGVLKRL